MEQQGLNGVNQNFHSLAKVPPANDVVYQGIRMNIGVGVIVVFDGATRFECWGEQGANEHFQDFDETRHVSGRARLR